MPTDTDRVEDVFHAAVAMASAAERAAYLDRACGDDPTLRERVEALLVSHDADDGFLRDRPGLGSVAATADLGAALRITEGPGTVIGRYKLLQLIGEGGFGSVFMAQQDRPVRRTVALKVIKLGMDTRQVIARFEAERQALALMDHENIARVLDGGATETGRPYFVMELVRGVPITEYCDTNNLSTPERLALFVPVCHAVQHAHQKGVIHRDLKPSNILVTMADGRPVPKVIDFGIAKATNARLTEATLFTEYRQLIGTPQYMSPEQAEMTGIDIDTRSDVYSLGVLLYELLTGTTPFDGRELRSKAYGEIQRIIREVEPPRPSTRVSGLGATLAATAAHRRTEPRKLGQLMRGELDWVVMKALEKDRTRRYETPSALAADVKRYLDNDPVAARPSSAAYRLRKFASKHKVGFAAAAAVVAALVLGIIGTSAGLVRANQQKALAQREAERATAVGGFLQSVLASARPDVVGGGQDAKVVDLLQSAESMIETELAGQPEAQIQTRYTLYATYCSLGLMSESRASLDRAYAAVQQIGKEQTEYGVRVALHTARIFNGPLDVRERIARTAAERAQRLLGEQHEVTLFSYGVMGQICQAAGKTAEADANYRRLEEGVRRLKSPQMTDPAIAMTLNDYAGVLKDRGEFARAETHYRQALKIAGAAKRRVFRVEVWASEGLGEVLRNQGKWQQAAEAYQHALADLRPRVGHTELRGLMTRYARALRRLNREADAEKVERQLDAAMAALAAAPASTAAALTGRAEVRIRMGQFKEAAVDAARAMELDPTQIYPWYYRGCLLAYLEDEPAYRAHCDAMLKQFERGDPRDGERTAKACLLLAGTPDVPRLSAMADRALAAHAGGDFRPWDQLVKAMAEYRAGRLDACIDLAGKAAEGLGNQHADGKAAAQLFAAMAHQQLGRPDKAGSIVQEVARYVEQDVPKFGVNGAGSDYSVENWLIL